MIGDQLFMEQMEQDMNNERFPHPKNSAIFINELYKISMIWDSSLSPNDRSMLMKYVARLMLRHMSMKDIKQLGTELQNGGK